MYYGEIFSFCFWSEPRLFLCYGVYLSFDMKNILRVKAVQCFLGLHVYV